MCAWFDRGMKRILLSWSGGKDSAWALHLLRQAGEFEVGGLLTTVNERFRRVAIHGFREELLERQAEMAGLPLWKVDLPFPCSNEDYESRMAVVCERAVREGFEGVAFGDLFLEEIRAYRMAKLAGTGLEPVFPVWGIPTDRLAEQMMAGGLRGRGMRPCGGSCRMGAIRVGRMGSSTRLRGRGLCSRGRFGWRLGSGWSGMGLFMRRWFRG